MNTECDFTLLEVRYSQRCEKPSIHYIVGFCVFPRVFLYFPEFFRKSVTSLSGFAQDFSVFSKIFIKFFFCDLSGYSNMVDS